MNIQKKYMCLLFVFSCLIAQENTITQQESSGVKNIANKSDETERKVKAKEVVANELRKILADNYVLYTKALNFHWNVEGELFTQLHEFFKKLYEDLQHTNDLLAERIRALGSYSPGSLDEFLRLTNLKENSGEGRSYKDMLQILNDDFETVIRSLHKAAQLTADNDDWGSNNMIADLIEKQEKNAWMIRSHLKK